MFAGGSKSDYDSLINLDQFTATHYAATGNALTMFANRVSYFFNWMGPSITIDTACSSSLTALHLAVQSLRRGECSTAVVGGSFLQLSPMLLSHMAAIGYVDPYLRYLPELNMRMQSRESRWNQLLFRLLCERLWPWRGR